MFTILSWHDETTFKLYVYMLSCYCSRPDAQLFEGQQQQEEEQQLNRELPDDILRRQLINNLAKHVLFSKKLNTAASGCTKP